MNANQVIEINDTYRNPEATGDYYPVRAFAPRTTFAPTTHPTCFPSARFVLDKEFNPVEKFHRLFPTLTGLLPLAGVVCCGSAAAATVGTPKEPPGDVDLFVYGVSPDNSAALWAVVKSVVDRLVSLQVEVTRFMVTQGIVKISTKDGPEVQIVLRAYRTVSSILHAFDIAPACVAYDGMDTYTTTFGMYGLQVACPVVPKYSSTSYRWRLKKYYNKGFPMELVNYVVPSGLESSWTRGWIRLKKAWVGSNHFSVSGGYVSDYDFRKLSSEMYSVAAWFLGGTTSPTYAGKTASELTQFLQVLLTGKKFTYLELMDPASRARLEKKISTPKHCRYLPGWMHHLRTVRNLPELKSIFQDWIRYPTIEGRKEVNLFGRIDAVLKDYYSTISRGRSFKDFYNFPREDYWEFSPELFKTAVRWAHYTKVTSKLPPTNLVATTVLTPKECWEVVAGIPGVTTRLLAKVQELNTSTKTFDPASWWITHDPGRQYTASRDPRNETYESWYGK